MTDRGGIRQERLRQHNLSVLLRHVHVRGRTSRAELTAVMALNRSTIGALTADLAAIGLIGEEPPAGPRGMGRPSLVVYPQTERVCALAFEIGVEYVAAARIGLGGRIIVRRELQRPRGDAEVAEVIAQLVGLATELLDVDGAPSLCVGAGVAVPGMIRATDGLVRLAPNLGWVDVPLGERFRDDLCCALGMDLPVRVGNDADLGALGEHTRGAAVGCQDAVFLTGGVGVGGGIITGGQPLAGHGGYAGELGHMVVHPGGRWCRCGSRGCWETEIGEVVLLTEAGAPGPPLDTVNEVLVAARSGDQAAVAAVRRMGEWLGLGVGNVVNIFNPEVVIFGGLFREILPDVIARMEKELRSTGFTAPREQVRLLPPLLGGDSTLHGAAELAFEQLLSHPLETTAALAI